MKVLRRVVIEEEVEPPVDLLTQQEAARRFGIPLKRLSALILGGHLDGYRVEGARAAKGGRQGLHVREADLQEWLKPIIIDGLVTEDA